MRRRMRSAAVPVHRQALPFLALDAGLVALAYYLAYWLRFDNGWPDQYRNLFEVTVVPALGFCVVSLVLSGAYRARMRWTSQSDYLVLARAVVLAVVGLVTFVAVLHPWEQTRGDGIVALTIPAGVVVGFLLLSLLFLAATRFVARLIDDRPIRGFRQHANARGVLVVGAGEGGRLLTKEMIRNPALGYVPVGFVDDDPAKRGMKIGGVKVHGSTDELADLLEDLEPDEVQIAIPSASGSLRGKVVSACREAGVPVRTLPTVYEILRGGTTVARQVRDVRVEDVLGREPVRMEVERVGDYLSGRVVLVTGAGGSIGAELCRQIARVGPSRLVLLDHAEDNLFEIQRELVEERHHAAFVEAVLADCKEGERMREVFAEHRPAIVFHAAAYKHVGLMESNPVEAVRNNAIATRVVTQVAGETGVSAFVLVSTDKAVHPATVMGASKALAEWATEAAGARFPQTRYAIVRFGNVLGSSGSVVPIFRKQIASGGPVTVTDPSMTRYFMTIPEAVQLIIQAGSLGAGGEVFVLEMGEPVSILELARQMIRLSGLEPERDIAIEFVGRRAGEKLHEDLFNSYETPMETEAPRILLAHKPAIDPRWVAETFDQIGLLVLEGDAAALAAKVAELSAARVGAQAAMPDPLAPSTGHAAPAPRDTEDWLAGEDLVGSASALPLAEDWLEETPDHDTPAARRAAERRARRAGSGNATRGEAMEGNGAGWRTTSERSRSSGPARPS